jgi:hypothetical protein
MEEFVKIAQKRSMFKVGLRNKWLLKELALLKTRQVFCIKVTGKMP